MIFEETRLQGAYVVDLKRIEDNRGFFARGFCVQEFQQQGLIGEMVQLNIAFSHTKGTVRGMHFQESPHAEAKLVRCTRGAIFDVIVDLRSGSPTRGQWAGFELSEQNGSMIYVPKGFAHGYQTLVDGTEMNYMTSAAYAASAAKGVRFDDPALGIQWPLVPTIVSDADRRWPDYVPEGQ